MSDFLGIMILNLNQLCLLRFNILKGRKFNGHACLCPTGNFTCENLERVVVEVESIAVTRTTNTSHGDLEWRLMLELLHAHVPRAIDVTLEDVEGRRCIHRRPLAIDGCHLLIGLCRVNS